MMPTAKKILSQTPRSSKSVNSAFSQNRSTRKITEGQIEKVQAILSLLKKGGPMDTKSILRSLPNIKELTLLRYLEHLTGSGHIRKIHAQGKPKNYRAYEFQSESGIKTDMLSQALSNPLHQLLFSTAGIHKNKQIESTAESSI